MLSLSDMQCLSRLEERWLDPDCIETYRDDEEAWNRADEEYAERGIYDEQGISKA